MLLPPCITLVMSPDTPAQASWRLGYDEELREGQSQQEVGETPQPAAIWEGTLLVPRLPPYCPLP